MTKREVTYGVVLDLGDDDEVLATWGGSIIVGTIEDLRQVFGGKVARFVPIAAKTTVSVVDIREHAPGMFVKLVDGQ